MAVQLYMLATTPTQIDNLILEMPEHLQQTIMDAQPLQAVQTNMPDVEVIWNIDKTKLLCKNGEWPGQKCIDLVTTSGFTPLNDSEAHTEKQNIDWQVTAEQI